MTLLEWRVQNIIKNMKQQWRFTNLSREFATRFEHEIALVFAPVKTTSEHKDKTSRAYLKQIESTTAQA